MSLHELLGQGSTYKLGSQQQKIRLKEPSDIQKTPYPPSQGNSDQERIYLRLSIEKLLCGKPLSSFDYEQSFNEMLEPQANPLHIAGFLLLLRAKGETASELASLVKILQEKMLLVPTQSRVLDIVGTGGDGFNTVNISTGSALLAASCGVKVAKHGNRSVSSLSGSADVLEALGVNIHMSPEKISACIDELGIGFCYAPNFHPALKTLKRLRQDLKVATICNLLGPLLNPTKPKYLILGVANESQLELMAEVLANTASTHALVVHGAKLDEISTAGLIDIIEVRNQERLRYILNPEDFGFKTCKIKDLQGGNAKLNAHLLLKAFQGEASALADSLILNSGLALYLYGLTSSIEEGLSQSRKVLTSGSVLTLITNWSKYSHEQ